MADKSDQNLKSKKELTLKHRCLSYGNFTQNQELMRYRNYVNDSGNTAHLPPVIKIKHPANKSCRFDKIECAGYLVAMIKRCPDKSSLTKNLKETALKNNQL